MAYRTRTARGRADLTRVARASDADVAALCALDVPLIPLAQQIAVVRESVRGGTAIAAWDDFELLGYVTWDFGFFRRPFVHLLVVGPAARRRGVGSDLLRAVEADVAERASSGGFQAQLFISTEAVNAPMQALLERLRYVPSGTIDNLNAPGNPELVYYKRL